MRSPEGEPRQRRIRLDQIPAERVIPAARIRESLQKRMTELVLPFIRAVRKQRGIRGQQYRIRESISES